jgi:hypothetical protein
LSCGRGRGRGFVLFLKTFFIVEWLEGGGGGVRFFFFLFLFVEGGGEGEGVDYFLKNHYGGWGLV